MQYLKAWLWTQEKLGNKEHQELAQEVKAHLDKFDGQLAKLNDFLANHHETMKSLEKESDSLTEKLIKLKGVENEKT